jgi:hypothetical protein
MRRMENAYNILVGVRESERENLEDLGVDGRILLNLIL